VFPNELDLEFAREVRRILVCPICQEMLNNPFNVRTCLHRFCSECIETYNRVAKKECPCCRAMISNRRTLRSDKKISAIMNTLKEEFAKLAREEELENKEITRKILQEQKKLKEKCEKQKAVVRNEFKRKFSDEYYERKKQDREEKRLDLIRQGKRSYPKGVSTEQQDIQTAIKFLEDKKARLQDLLLPVDIEIELRHDEEQHKQFTQIQKIRVKASRTVSLIHLAILLTHRNGNREEEWPNYEMYIKEPDM